MRTHFLLNLVYVIFGKLSPVFHKTLSSNFWLSTATTNKCIVDDTKAAARQSPNCIKKTKKIKYGEKRLSIWRMEFLHPLMWNHHDIDFAM